MLVLEFVWKPMEEIGKAVLVLREVATGINHCLAAARHALYEAVERAGWQRAPTFLQNLD